MESIPTRRPKKLLNSGSGMTKEKNKNKKTNKDNKNNKVGFFAPLFNPKLFIREMKKGQMKGHYIAGEKRAVAAKGMERIEKRRGKGWLNFWLWMPIWSFFIFWREGKKAEKEENE